MVTGPLSRVYIERKVINKLHSKRRIYGLNLISEGNGGLME